MRLKCWTCDRSRVELVVPRDNYLGNQADPYGLAFSVLSRTFHRTQTGLGADPHTRRVLGARPETTGPEHSPNESPRGEAGLRGPQVVGLIRMVRFHPRVLDERRWATIGNAADQVIHQLYQEAGCAYSSTGSSAGTRLSFTPTARTLHAGSAGAGLKDLWTCKASSTKGLA